MPAAIVTKAQTPSGIHAELRHFFDRAHLKANGNLVVFSEEILKIQRGIRRKNGLTEEDHGLQVRNLAMPAIRGRIYERSGAAAALGHDGDENVLGVVIISSADYREVIRGGIKRFPTLAELEYKIILNEELGYYGKEGRDAASIIYMLTKKPKAIQVGTGHAIQKVEIPKSEYERGIFLKVDSSIDESKERGLIALLDKNCDRLGNTSATEQLSEMYAREKALKALDKAEHGPNGRIKTLEEIVQNAGIKSKFYEDGRFTFDEKVFSDASERERFIEVYTDGLRMTFEWDRKEQADKNIDIFIPESERRLLMRIGNDGGRFNMDKAVNFDLYDFEAVRAVVKGEYEESIRILLMKGTDPSEIVYRARRAGPTDWDTEVKGYPAIINELADRMGV
jgi:hypothetical protein